MELDMLEALRVTTEAISQTIPNDMQEVNGKLHLSRDGKTLSKGISVNADTLDGKHADNFVAAEVFENLVGDIPVTEQISAAINAEELGQFATTEALNVVSENVDDNTEAINNLKTLVGNDPIADQINTAIEATNLSQFATTEALERTNNEVGDNSSAIDNLKTLVGGISVANQISDALDNLALGDTYAGKEHTHKIADITDLEAAINNKDPQVLPSGADFNDYLKIDNYVGETVLGNNTEAYYKNAPSVVQASFLLSVLPTGVANQIIQRLTICSKGYSRKWERHYHSGSWGEWYCTYADRNTILWSGAELMEARDKVVTLSEPISKQPTGVALLFSRAENGAPVDYHFVTEFISKDEVLIYNGKGHAFSLFKHSGPFSAAGSKYLYIYNDRIEGNTNNALSGTGECGIKYDNSLWYLRRVIGV